MWQNSGEMCTLASFLRRFSFSIWLSKHSLKKMAFYSRVFVVLFSVTVTIFTWFFLFCFCFFCLYVAVLWPRKGTLWSFCMYLIILWYCSRFDFQRHLSRRGRSNRATRCSFLKLLFRLWIALVSYMQWCVFANK